MEIYSIATITLCAIIIILLVAVLLKSKKTDTAVLSKEIELTSRQLSERTDRLSESVEKLTSRNHEQQLLLIETLNKNAMEQTKIITDSVLTMQKGNEEKLEQMRQTVDEKLTSTLNKRLTESFSAVSEQLSNVHKSLGEMKELSAGVTTTVSGLNRTLSNVKARGTWAEVQLEALLDETIPGMYEKNVQTNPNNTGRVEFAIKIPNQGSDSCIYLPIDSKFPLEDYIRLTEAADSGDKEATEAARKALENRVRDEAKLIKKYISAPETTPFAIMYLATEGLYAEIISSKSGIAEAIQRNNIMIAGPSTITALLTSLAMGFRTIAINQKANEVWDILAKAKKQYDTFGDLLEKARKKIEDAGKVIDEANDRNRIIQKSLKNVEVLEDTTI